MNKNDDYKEPLTANIGEGFGEVLKNYKAGNPDSNSVSGKDESPALKDAKDLGAAATKKKEGVPFFEFGRKYKDFFQKDVFSEFNENTKKPSGQWLHISSYDANKGTVEYYLGKAGGRNRYDEKKEANLNELDEILKGYSYSLKGEGIGIKKNPEKSSKKKGAATIKKIQEKPDKKKKKMKLLKKH